MKDSPLKKEFEFYLAHQAELVEKYNGKFISLKDGNVLGAYETAAQAISATKQIHPLGTFLVQKVEPGTGAYTQTFHSRVIFA